MQGALKVFDEMTVKGVAPNVITYNILIDGSCKEGSLSRARDLQEM
jgi:leucine-rich PPR motif-containing protein, mitochondrial